MCKMNQIIHLGNVLVHERQPGIKGLGIVCAVDLLLRPLVAVVSEENATDSACGFQRKPITIFATQTFHRVSIDKCSW